MARNYLVYELIVCSFLVISTIMVTIMSKMMLKRENKRCFRKFDLSVSAAPRDTRALGSKCNFIRATPSSHQFSSTFTSSSAGKFSKTYNFLFK